MLSNEDRINLASLVPGDAATKQPYQPGKFLLEKWIVLKVAFALKDRFSLPCFHFPPLFDSNKQFPCFD